MAQSKSSQSCIIDRKRAAQAYDEWRIGRSTKAALSVPKQLIKSIYDQLPLHFEAGPKLGLPESKQAWSDWRNRSFARPHYLEREICEAVLLVTGFDITVEQEMSNFCTNVTDVAILDKFVAKRLSNAPTDGQEEYELKITRLDFRQSATVEVTADWVKSRSNKDDRIRILGTMKWGIREAVIDIADSTRLNCRLEMLAAGEITENGELSTSIQCLIEDGFSEGRWLVQSAPGQVLSGLCKDVIIARNRCEASSEIVLTVSTRVVDVVPDFLPFGTGVLRQDDLQKAKDRLISKVLSLKLTEDATEDYRLLSRARISAP